MFQEKYADVFKGDEQLAEDLRADRRHLRLGRQPPPMSQNPPYFVGMEPTPKPVRPTS
jgi:aconitase A